MTTSSIIILVIALALTLYLVLRPLLQSRDDPRLERMLRVHTGGEPASERPREQGDEEQKIQREIENEVVRLLDRLAGDEPAPRFCPECGARLLNEGQKFCHACGKPIKWEGDEDEA